MAVADYRDLIAWQKSMDLAVDVYDLTRQFPVDERFGLTNQLRRSVVSLASNIAEGQGRGAGKEFIHFLRIANGSRQEAGTQIEVALRLGYIDATKANHCLSAVDEVGRILQGLVKSLQ